MAYIELNITPNSKPMEDSVYEEISDLSLDNGGNGIEVLANDDIAIPWDASCYIEDGNFVIDGHVGPSGLGYAVAKVPLGKVKGHLDIQIFADGEGAEGRLKEIFTKYGWI